MSVAPPTAGGHLAILRDAGSIDSSQAGRTATHELTQAGTLGATPGLSQRVLRPSRIDHGPPDPGAPAGAGAVRADDALPPTPGSARDRSCRGEGGAVSCRSRQQTKPPPSRRPRPVGRAVRSGGPGTGSVPADRAKRSRSAQQASGSGTRPARRPGRHGRSGQRSTGPLVSVALGTEPDRPSGQAQATPRVVRAARWAGFSLSRRWRVLEYQMPSLWSCCSPSVWRVSM